MNADAFRQFYEYHFAENRKIWDTYASLLSQEQFLRESSYSVGSVHNQIVHLIGCDEGWFNGLRGAENSPETPEQFEDRQTLRAYWDGVEQMMRDYLATVSDAMLFEHPFAHIDMDEKNLILWQVLLHVANHGTDHRAQILRLLNDLGVDTKAQDYIFYLFDKM